MTIGLATQELTTLFFVAIALGLDAFSICLGLGMQQLRLRNIIWIGIVIGGFHIFMPLLGMLIGKLLSTQMESYSNLFSGAILLVIGLHMFFSVFTEKKKSKFKPVGVGLFVIALSVSIDSFSVGLGLGLSDFQTTIALLFFGTSSALLAWLALFLAKYARSVLGQSSELLGASILCGFGLYFIFGM